MFSIDFENSKKNWDFTTGGKISHIIETPEGILVLSLDNFIYSFAKDSSKLDWKVRSPGRNIIFPVIIENSAIITNLGTNISNIYDLNSGRLRNKITIEDNNQFLEKPIITNNMIVYPTLQGLYVFKSNICQ